MGRRIRWLPEGGGLVEITHRTFQGRHLLTPSPELRLISIGVLARAQELYGVRICGLSFLSNHYHLLLEVEDLQQMRLFMQHVNSNLSREIGRLVDWSGKFFSDRYKAIPISDEEPAQSGRLKYVLAHGVKEGLVERPEEWPGLHGSEALQTGEPLEGIWIDRTRYWAARNRGRQPTPTEYTREMSLVLDPLPCWRHLAPAAVRQHVTELIELIVAEAREERRITGSEVLGAEAVRQREPKRPPKRLKSRVPPLVHAASRAVRRQLLEAYSAFLSAFREASARLRAGDRQARLPPGCFPPPLSFVAFEPAPS